MRFTLLGIVCNTLLTANAFSAVALISPAEMAVVEVDKPMLFWKNVSGVERYSVSIDDAKSIEIPATAGDVSHVGISSTLASGSHSWTVRCVGKDEAASTTGHFKIELTKRWPAWAIGPFQRFAGSPVLGPQGSSWEARNVYNPGFIFEGDTVRMLYRAQAQNMKSQIGYAESADGVTFKREDAPIIPADKEFETTYGCEDARLFKLGDTFYAFYTGNVPGTANIALCEATSKDCRLWTKLGVIQSGTKNGALLCDAHNLPLKVDGKYVLYVGDSKVGVCYSEDLTHWSAIDWLDLELPSDWVRPYEPCYAVSNLPGHEQDIVFFIAGLLNGKGKWYYAISEVLLKKPDTHHVVERLDDCIFKPSASYESGEFKDCLWMNGIVEHDGQWWMYYGAGDRNVGLATAPLH